MSLDLNLTGYDGLMNPPRGTMIQPVQGVEAKGSMASLRLRPFIIAGVVYAVVTAAILIISAHKTGGHFIYALDDTYINMAMAKNFALHGVWGITPYEFSSSSSAPFFVLLLSSIYFVTGPSQCVPLALSWLFGLASIWVAARMLAESLTEVLQTVALIAMVMLTPLFLVGTLGMEHSLHLLLTLLFLERFDRSVESAWTIAAITSAMVGTRYEGMFVAAAGCLILLLERRWSRAAVIAGSAWLPVCCYAAFSMFHGGFWIPNSVAIKGFHNFGLSIQARILSQLRIFFSNSILGIHLFFLLAALAVTAVVLRKTRIHLANMTALLTVAGCLHIVLAGVGWAFRYEDYLVGAMIIVGASSYPVLVSYRKSVPIAVAIFYFCSAAFLMARSLNAAIALPRYSRAIYIQQWQMARFLHSYYPDAAVAANDIGAINFINNLHCLDMVGLASTEVFSAKRTGTYSTQFLNHLAQLRGVRIAIIYDSWFPPYPNRLSEGPPIPASWTRVGRWRVDHKEQLGGDTVSFYALTPADVLQLQAHLAQFNATLPQGETSLPPNPQF